MSDVALPKLRLQSTLRDYRNGDLIPISNEIIYLNITLDFPNITSVKAIIYETLKRHLNLPSVHKKLSNLNEIILHVEEFEYFVNLATCETLCYFDAIDRTDEINKRDNSWPKPEKHPLYGEFDASMNVVVYSDVALCPHTGLRLVHNKKQKIVTT